MTYKIRDGIVMETICGVTLLIATLEASASCPYAAELNEASAYIWTMLFAGRSLEEMTDQAARDFEMTREEAREILRTYLEELADQNYLLVQQEEVTDEI